MPAGSRWGVRPLVSAARCWAADPVRSSSRSGSIPIGKWLRGGWTSDGFAIVSQMTAARQPWDHDGWFEEMSAWVDARLADAGIRRRGPVRQVRAWARAALLTLDSDHGRLWAKAVPAVFAHEIAVTELLADVDPGIVPPVVAADRALGRIITEHVEGSTLAAIGDDPVIWTATLSRLAEIQRVLAADLDALRVAGVAAAPLDRLAVSVPALLADDDLLLRRPAGRAVELRGRVAQASGAGLRRCLSRPRRERRPGQPGAWRPCRRRDHPGTDGPGVPRLVGWVDHPSVPVRGLAPADPARRRAATRTGSSRRISARGWRAARSRPPTAARALDLARTVLPLHLAAMYAERILPGLETARRDGPRGAGRVADYPAGVTRQRIPDDVLSAAHARSKARAARDWPEADRLRADDRGGRLADRRPGHGLRAVAGGRRRRDRRRAGPLRIESERPVPSRGAVDRAGDDRPARHRLAGRPARARSTAFERQSPAGTSVVIVADGPSAEQAEALEALATARRRTTIQSASDPPIEIVWTSERLGHAAAVNAGMRRATAPVAVLMDTSVEPTGDVVTPLVAGARRSNGRGRGRVGDHVGRPAQVRGRAGRRGRRHRGLPAGLPARRLRRARPARRAVPLLSEPRHLVEPGPARRRGGERAAARGPARRPAGRPPRASRLHEPARRRARPAEQAQLLPDHRPLRLAPGPPGPSGGGERAARLTGRLARRRTRCPADTASDQAADGPPSRPACR